VQAPPAARASRASSSNCSAKASEGEEEEEEKVGDFRHKQKCSAAIPSKHVNFKTSDVTAS
jgi:hypothetical protein